MTSTRRSFLRLLGGAAATSTAGSTMSASQAAQILGASTALTQGQNVEAVGISANPVALHNLIGTLYREQEVARTPIEHMPHYIRSKKSWSPAFKSMVHQHEQRLFHEAIRRLEEEEGLIERIFGITVGD